MVLNDYGIIVNDEWERTFKIRKNVIQDVYVIMPNHFHSIIGISDDLKINGNSVPNDGIAAIGGDSVPNNGIATINGVETPCHGVSTVGAHQMGGTNKPVGSNQMVGSNCPKSVSTPIGQIERTPTIIPPITTHWKSGVLGAIIVNSNNRLRNGSGKMDFPDFIGNYVFMITLSGMKMN
jgi:hypothetical protein